jgi:hypothetical protein
LVAQVARFVPDDVTCTNAVRIYGPFEASIALNYRIKVIDYSKRQDAAISAVLRPSWAYLNDANSLIKPLISNGISSTDKKLFSPIKPYNKARGDVSAFDLFISLYNSIAIFYYVYRNAILMFFAKRYISSANRHLRREINDFVFELNEMNPNRILLEKAFSELESKTANAFLILKRETIITPARRPTQLARDIVEDLCWQAHEIMKKIANDIRSVRPMAVLEVAFRNEKKLDEKVSIELDLRVVPYHKDQPLVQNALYRFLVSSPFLKIESINTTYHVSKDIPAVFKLSFDSKNEEKTIPINIIVIRNEITLFIQTVKYEIGRDS